MTAPLPVEALEMSFIWIIEWPCHLVHLDTKTHQTLHWSVTVVPKVKSPPDASALGENGLEVQISGSDPDPLALMLWWQGLQECCKETFRCLIHIKAWEPLTYGIILRNTSPDELICLWRVSFWEFYNKRQGIQTRGRRIEALLYCPKCSQGSAFACADGHRSWAASVLYWVSDFLSQHKTLLPKESPCFNRICFCLY